jgi:hypothetical protein
MDFLGRKMEAEVKLSSILLMTDLLLGKEAIS